MNTRMKFLEHELAEQEREQLRKAETKEQPAPAVPDNTLALERKIKELEALVNGLTEEMLDLKSITRKLSAQVEKLGGQPVKPHEPIVRGVKKPEPAVPHTRSIQETLPEEAPATPARAPERTVVRRPQPAAAPQKPVERQISSPVPKPAAPVEEENLESLKPGEYEFVMQPDGSIQKRRKTTQGNVIIAGTGYAPGKASRSSAIRADSHAVIEADEDDTITIE